MDQLTTDAAPVKTSQVLNQYYPAATPSYTSYRYSSTQQNALVLSTYASNDTRFLCKPIIFNHKTYSKLTYGSECPNVREGTDEDVRRLQATFQSLGNCDNADVYADKTVLEIEDILKKAVQSDQSAYSCLMVIVLTHGDKHLLYAYDSTYSIGLLWKALTDSKLSNGTLAGKPKIFFIQACRGSDLDAGQNVVTDYPSKTAPQFPQRIPLCADILIAYSSFLGYKSVRNTMLGSWFIQTLCDCVDTYRDSHDLLTMLTIVQHSVANSKVFQFSKKQIPCVETTLTKRLYLTNKSVVVEPRVTRGWTATRETAQRVLQADEPREEVERVESGEGQDAGVSFKWMSAGIVVGVLASWMAKKFLGKR